MRRQEVPGSVPSPRRLWLLKWGSEKTKRMAEARDYFFLGVPSICPFFPGIRQLLCVEEKLKRMDKKSPPRIMANPCKHKNKGPFVDLGGVYFVAQCVNFSAESGLRNRSGSVHSSQAPTDRCRCRMFSGFGAWAIGLCSASLTFGRFGAESVVWW